MVALFALVITFTKALIYFMNYKGYIKIGELMYGFNQINFSSLNLVIYGILTFIICILICIPKINKKIMVLFDFAYNIVDKNKSKNKYINYLIICIIFFLLFFILKNGVIPLGDSWGDLIEKAKGDLSFRFFLSGLIPSYIGFRTYTLLNHFFGVNGDTSLSILSIIYGVIFIFFLLLLCDSLVKDKKQKVMLFLFVVSSGFINLFFGYVEITPLLSMLVIIYIYTSYLYLKGKLDITIPTLIICLAFWSHGSAGWYFPSLLFLHMASLKTNKLTFNNFFKIFFNSKFLKLILIFLIPTLLFLIAIEIESYYGFNEHINIKSIGIGNFGGGGDGRLFIPISKVLTIRERFTMFSFAHLIEMVNEHIILSAFGIFLCIFILLTYYKKINFKDPFLFFLFVMVVFYLVECSTDNKDLGDLADWDSFSSIAVPYTIAGGYLLTRYVKKEEYVKSIGLIIITTNLIFTIPWILGNAGLM